MARMKKFLKWILVNFDDFWRIVTSSNALFFFFGEWIENTLRKILLTCKIRLGSSASEKWGFLKIFQHFSLESKRCSEKSYKIFFLLHYTINMFVFVGEMRHC